MAAQSWQWSSSARRFREKSTGKFLSAAKALELRDQFNETQREAVSALAERLASGEVTLAGWESGMRDHLRTVYLAQAMYGRGGVNAMDDAAYGSVGSQLRVQYGFLRAFAEDIAAERLTLPQIQARASLYVSSATQAYERGRAQAWGVSLPQFPGDGQTACLASCRCNWSIRETADEWRATWRTGGAEQCPDCEENAARWSPLVIQKGEERVFLAKLLNGCCK